MSKEASTEKASEKFRGKNKSSYDDDVVIFLEEDFEVYDQLVSLEAKIEELEKQINRIPEGIPENRGGLYLRSTRSDMYFDKLQYQSEYDQLIEQHNL